MNANETKVQMKWPLTFLCEQERKIFINNTCSVHAPWFSSHHNIRCCSTSNCHVVMNAIIVQSCSLLSPLSAISASLHITRYWQWWLRNEGHYLSTLSTESQLIWWLQYLLPISLYLHLLCHYAMHILCPYLVCTSLQWCLRPAIYSHSWSVVTALPPPPPTQPRLYTVYSPEVGFSLALGLGNVTAEDSNHSFPLRKL